MGFCNEIFQFWSFEVNIIWWYLTTLYLRTEKPSQKNPLKNPEGTSRYLAFDVTALHYVQHIFFFQKLQEQSAFLLLLNLSILFQYIVLSINIVLIIHYYCIIMIFSPIYILHLELSAHVTKVSRSSPQSYNYFIAFEIQHKG